MKITKKHILSFVILSLLTISQTLIIFPLSYKTVNAQTTSTTSVLDGQTGMQEIKTVYGGSIAETDIRETIAKFIVIALGFLASIFVVLILIAGYRYMMANGNTETTAKAISSIQHAIIGLVITIAAWGISRWVLIRIQQAVSNNISTFD